MKQLLISGIDGRMGREVERLAAEYGFSAQAFAPGKDGDVIIDFSHSDCLDGLLKSAVPLVIGTTGFSPDQQAQIAAAAQARPIFQAANFSLGVYALGMAAQSVRTLLKKWDVALIERHHVMKQDMPSGTALVLAEQISISPDQIVSIRGGTVRGVHEISLFGPEEHLSLLHVAESRAVFAHGALQAASWLLHRPNGLYGMDDLAQSIFD